MITSIHKVVLMGASGVLGSAILQSLLSSSHPFKITVISRPESQSSFAPSITHLKVAHDLPSLTSAFANHDAVICATHLSTIAHQTSYIAACLAAGVKRYITNDFGNAPDFPGLPDLEWTRQPKLEILDYVQAQAETHPEFSWTALATGHFLDYAIEKFPAVFGFDVGGRKARLVDGGEERFSATVLSDIGDAVVGVLREGERSKNRYLVVRTLETTQRELLDAFEEVMGETWTVEDVSSKELYEAGKKMVEGGEQRKAILSLLPVQIFEKGAGRYAFPKERYDNELLGIKEKSAKQVVMDVLAKM